MKTGFHESNGVYFNRNEDGSVTITKYKDRSEDVEFQHTVTEGPWCSVISSMSKGGEIDRRFYAAQEFHRSSGEIEIVAKQNATT